jgi:hypothetical protein
LICRPSSHQSAAGSDFETRSRVSDLGLVLTDDFRPAASHIRSSPGKADRHAASIGTQAQREQIGEAEGSLYVEPAVGSSRTPTANVAEVKRSKASAVHESGPYGSLNFVSNQRWTRA